MSSNPVADPATRAVSLEAKWAVTKGRIFLNGTQALARVLLAQRWLDQRASLNTAGFITGYRGSPLGNVDTTLWSIADRLENANIVFRPGVNEDLAATAVHGSQQLNSVPDPAYDGVFAAWYGKGPGVDRSGDAIKHGNFAGAHRNGGVALFYGDDHGGKSSTVAHHSEQAMAAAYVPSLYPSSVQELLEYGLLAFAMSRYSGAWVGIKCVNEVVEQTASIDIDLESFAPISPASGTLPPEGIHAATSYRPPLREEQIAGDFRLPLIQRFVRANGIDHVVIAATRPRLGLVTAGKSHADTLQALALLGLTPAKAAAIGLSLYKVGCIWPLEPTGIADFACSQEVLFVIEEKQAFLEPQVAAAIVNRPERPLLIGKADEAGAPLVPSTLQLEPAQIAVQIADRLARLGMADDAILAARSHLVDLQSSGPELDPAATRSPYFCSGCPHNRSTRTPEGSMSMTGIGCHTMVLLADPSKTIVPTQMGGEGSNWIGLAPFTGTRHVFQNMGDGTYYHSGLLAIRAAAAAGVNITYKILYNDAVAMTGGQPVDGPISVAEIAQQVIHEGAKAVVLLSDNPDAHRANPAIPRSVRIGHRDELDEVQRELREMAGCTVLIYEQTCAAEKRRRRKRQLFPDPPKRLFIAKSVCEGCGDCSVQSTCVSITPVETDFGTKRQIDQSSCNKDYSCANGFCPSFLTVYDAPPRKPAGARMVEDLFDGLVPPTTRPLGDRAVNILITGIGGTGVITVAAILGMAAHIEGKATSMFDMTGLAQKNGAVFSHLRIAASPAQIHAPRLGRGETDLLLAFDVVGALSDEARKTYAKGRTRVLANSDVATTVAFQFDREARVDQRLLVQRLGALVGPDAVDTIDAVRLATALLGDSIAANLFLIGAAAQKGLLPVGLPAIEEAVRLNGTAVDFNLTAMRLGRLFVMHPDRILGLVAPPASLPDPSLPALIERRARHLTAYQDARLAARYRQLVALVEAAEVRAVGTAGSLARNVAVNYAKLLAYKDEYEVARMLTDPALEAEIATNFADGARLAYNLAPPILGGKPVNGRPRKREFSARWLRPALRVLARCKRLRGTPFDPFGGTQERRGERALIADYEQAVAEVIAGLTVENHHAAVEWLGLADLVRGYGPVKLQAVAKYRERFAQAREAFRTAAVVDSAAA